MYCKDTAHYIEDNRCILLDLMVNVAENLEEVKWTFELKLFTAVCQKEFCRSQLEIKHTASSPSLEFGLFNFNINLFKVHIVQRVSKNFTG